MLWSFQMNTVASDTRQQILSAAFSEIHVHGFQAASLSRILTNLGMTKGAIYHHFPNKTALGYAVVDEVIRQMVVTDWIDPMKNAENPLDALIAVLMEAGDSMTKEDLALGCPLANLSQEMSSLDEGFRHRLEAIYSEWRDTMRDALSKGQEKHLVRDDIDPTIYTTFIVSSLEGCLATAKNAQDMSILIDCGHALIEFLNSLRPQTHKEK